MQPNFVDYSRSILDRLKKTVIQINPLDLELSENRIRVGKSRSYPLNGVNQLRPSQLPPAQSDLDSFHGALLDDTTCLWKLQDAARAWITSKLPLLTGLSTSSFFSRFSQSVDM